MQRRFAGLRIKRLVTWNMTLVIFSEAKSVKSCQ